MTPPSTAARRRRRIESRNTFFLVVIAITSIAFLSLVLQSVKECHGSASPVWKRDLDPLEEQECRRVHQAEDKCAFIKQNCPDEEAGIFSYLTLYYCRLPHAKPVAFAIITLWLALLFSTIGIAASDFFSVNLSTIATLFGMSDNLAGVTFLAFGNGSPDIFSTFAAMKTNSGSLAVGELIGAASFITAVIAGSIAFVRPFKVGRKSFVRDVIFFIIAASFSLVFLADGMLMLWEACVLVGLYFFYVGFVLMWHWWIHRRRRKRQKEAAAREHFIVPGSEDIDTTQQYHDDEEEGTVGRHSRQGTIRGVSAEDLAALEQDDQSDDEVAETQVEHAAVVINRNMRLSRPRGGQRRHTHVPIRPSLVGALEYRALLAELQKSGNIQSAPIHLRRYSDDPRMPTTQVSTTEEPRTAPPADSHVDNDGLLRPEPQGRTATGSQLRAVSVNEVDALRLDPSALPKLETPDLLVPLDEDNAGAQRDRPTTATSGGSFLRATSPSISLSPPPSNHSREHSPAPQRAPTSPTFLAPPDPFQHNVQASAAASSSAAVSPRSQSPKPKAREYPKVSIPAESSSKSSPRSPFPTYTDEIFLSPVSKAGSIRLPPASASPDSHFRSELIFEADRRPLKWWPYTVLPPPEQIASTLFPTLCGWNEKNVWQKIIGLISAPSVLLLTVTLPVIETSRDDDDSFRDDDIPDLSLPGTVSSQDTTARAKIAAKRADSNTPLLSGQRSSGHASSSDEHGLSGHGDVATIALSAERHYEHAYPEERTETLSDRGIVGSPEQMPTTKDDVDPNDWSKWLVIIQMFTAPLFMVLIVWANTDQEHPQALIRPTLISLLISCVGLLIILTLTTPTRAPRWRIVLCLVGFTVSIAWISSIANEVVGVLKALGVVLNISDAILGLTIFAVGNSCGDLVANITVAKLGYPVMALSACFGGPMLNILLGIGISGVYLILTAAGNRVDKHPEKKWKVKPYHIDVSKTLLISGATLLVTLLVLLILVPWKSWKMDRSLGWMLIGIWLVSTAVNVGVELSGVGTSSSA